MRHVFLVFFLLTVAAVSWGGVSGDWDAAMPGIVLGAGPLVAIVVARALSRFADRVAAVRWEDEERRARILAGAIAPAIYDADSVMRGAGWTPPESRRIRARAGKYRGRK